MVSLFSTASISLYLESYHLLYKIKPKSIVWHFIISLYTMLIAV